MAGCGTCGTVTINNEVKITSNYVAKPKENPVEQLLSITVEKKPNVSGQGTTNN